MNFRYQPLSRRQNCERHSVSCRSRRTTTRSLPLKRRAKMERTRDRTRKDGSRMRPRGPRAGPNSGLSDVRGSSQREARLDSQNCWRRDDLQSFTRSHQQVYAQRATLHFLFKNSTKLIFIDLIMNFGRYHLYWLFLLVSLSIRFLVAKTLNVALSGDPALSAPSVESQRIRLQICRRQGRNHQGTVTSSSWWKSRIVRLDNNFCSTFLFLISKKQQELYRLTKYTPFNRFQHTLPFYSSHFLFCKIPA